MPDLLEKTLIPEVVKGAAADLPIRPNAGTAEKITPTRPPLLPPEPTKPRMIISQSEAIKDVNKIQAEEKDITIGMEEQKVRLEEEKKEPPVVNLKDIATRKGLGSDFASLQKLAEQYGIPNFIGTIEQQEELADILQNQPEQASVEGEAMRGAISDAISPKQAQYQSFFINDEGKTRSIARSGTNLVDRESGEIINIYDDKGNVLPQYADAFKQLDRLPDYKDDEGDLIATQTPEQQFSNQIRQYSNQIDDAYQSYTSDLQKLRTGAIPLSPEEQGQFDEINRVFDEIKAQQLTANKNYEKATEIASIAGGRSRYAPEIAAGELAQAVNLGISKIANIETKRISSINELRSAIRDKNYSEINNAYDRFRQYSQDKMNAMKDIFSVAKEAQDKADAIVSEQNKAIENERLEFEKQKNDIISEATKNGATPEIISAINSSENFAEAMTSAGDFLQEGTGLAAEYLFYKRQELANGRVPMDFGRYKAIEDQREINIALAKKAASASATASGEKPATQAQYKMAGYASRIEHAGETLTNMEEVISSMNPIVFEAQTRMPVWLQNDDIQVYEQAARNFINAVLRQESGAAIAESEFDSAEKQYLPKAGDSDSVLEQKRINRESVFTNFRRASGSAYESVGDLLGKSARDIAQEKSINTEQFISSYVQQSPENESKVRQILEENPNLSDEDLVQIIEQQ
jgi:hypothetical protein